MTMEVTHLPSHTASLEKSIQRRLGARTRCKGGNSLPSLHPSTEKTGDDTVRTVPKSFAMRMEHDATLNPAMLEMRMNSQNMRKEVQHFGKVVSGNFALMRPRPRQTASKHLVPLESFRESRRGGFLVSAGDRGSQQTRFIPIRRPTVDEIILEKAMCEFQLLAVFRALGVGSWENGSSLPRARVIRALLAIGCTPDTHTLQHALPWRYEQLPDCPAGDEHEPNLDFRDFATAVVICRKRRSKEIRNEFARIDTDHSGAICFDEFINYIRGLNLTMTMSAIKDIFREVDIDCSGDLDIHEFESTMKLVQDRHGFTSSQMEEIHKVFDRYDSDRDGEINIEQLRNSLCWYGLPTDMHQAQELGRRYDSDGNGTVCKQEFLRIVRGRYEDDIELLRFLFDEQDAGKKGDLRLEEIMVIFSAVGCAGRREIFEEAMCDLQMDSDQKIKFDAAVELLECIRSKHVFLRRELTELDEVYRTHTSHDDGMRAFEMSRALMWLGFNISARRCAELWSFSDVDRSDYLEDDEWVKLVRRIREDEVEEAKKLAQKSSSKQYTLSLEALRTLYRNLGYSPSDALFEEVITKFPRVRTTGLDLISCLESLHIVRCFAASNIRQCAGLQEQFAGRIRFKFGLRLEAGKLIEPSELEKAVLELYKINKSNAFEKESVRKLITREGGNSGLTLVQAFAVARKFGDLRAEASWRREIEAAKANNFSALQTAQFREAYLEADVDCNGWLSDVEVLDVLDEVLALTLPQLHELRVELRLLGAGRDEIDFTEFLNLLGTMMRKTQGAAPRDKSDRTLLPSRLQS